MARDRLTASLVAVLKRLHADVERIMDSAEHDEQVLKFRHAAGQPLSVASILSIDAKILLTSADRTALNMLDFIFDSDDKLTVGDVLVLLDRASFLLRLLGDITACEIIKDQSHGTTYVDLSDDRPEEFIDFINNLNLDDLDGEEKHDKKNG